MNIFNSNKAFKMKLQLFADKSLKEILGEELFNQVTAKLGDNKIDIVSNGQWIPKDKFDQVNEDKKSYKKQVDDLNTDLGTLKAKLKDNEDASNTIENLKIKIADNEKAMADVRRNAAIDLALKDNKAKNAKAVKALLKLESVKLSDDGTIKGLDEQLKELKESDSYLFEVETPGGTGGSQGNHQRQTNNDKNPTGDANDFVNVILENQAKRN